MCGLNGIFAHGSAAPPPDRDELIRTRDAMLARGPDGAGEWASKDRRCLLGHRRLSIIDLSDRALQPMSTSDGKLTVVYNGEIYNFPTLRRAEEALGTQFMSNSDTEVLLHLYRRYGEDCVQLLRGMFAFAIWDAERGGLFLARDPFGIKPLYYSNSGGTFRFASQVKAVLAGGAVSRDPDPAAIAGFYLTGSIPEPFSWCAAISALPAGHSLWVDGKGAQVPRRFYSLPKQLAEIVPWAASPNLADHVGDAVRESISAHMLADVEIGLFLSAGIDSSTMLAHLSDQGAAIRSITVGFAEFANSHSDETPLATQVAAQCNSPHVIRMVSREEFAADCDAILEAMDQPSIDGINSWFAAKAAKEAGLKVVLSGLGADEHLGGYDSFDDVPRWRRRFGAVAARPRFGHSIAAALEKFAPGFVARTPKLPGLFRHAASWEGAWLLRRGLFLPEELDQVMSPQDLAEGAERLGLTDIIRAAITPDPGNDMARVAALESGLYMRNQLLRDTDWAGMAHSVEIRLPFVDTVLMASLGGSLLDFADHAGKMALAQSPVRPLVRQVMMREKTGFSVPMDRWMGDMAGLDVTPELSEGLIARNWSRHVAKSFFARSPTRQ